MVALKYLLLMFVPIVLSTVAHAMPGRKEDGHYKDGEHNDEYDQQAFLGKAQQKEFSTLTDEERLERLGELVDKIDKNKDGNISESELTDWIKYVSLKEPRDLAKQLWDEKLSEETKADALLSWEEYMNLYFPAMHYDDPKIKKRIAKNRRRFIAADENKDDQLSLDEYVAFGHPDLFDRTHDIFITEAMEGLDLNNDGVCSYEEFTKARSESGEDDIKRHFEDKDANNDGVLDKAELKETYFPSSYDIDQNEADHIIFKADTDKDKVLTKKEILENYDIFVGSKATHWGETLKRPVDEL